MHRHLGEQITVSLSPLLLDNKFVAYYQLDANINLQMFYWAAEATNMDVTQSLWDYMEV